MENNVPKPAPQFEIVRRGQARMPAWGLLLALFLVGVVVGGGLAWWLARPTAGSPEARLAESDKR